MNFHQRNPLFSIFLANEGNVLETVTVDVDGEQTSLLLIDSNGDEGSDFSVRLAMLFSTIKHAPTCLRVADV